MEVLIKADLKAYAHFEKAPQFASVKITDGPAGCVEVSVKDSVDATKTSWVYIRRDELLKAAELMA